MLPVFKGVFKINFKFLFAFQFPFNNLPRLIQIILLNLFVDSLGVARGTARDKVAGKGFAVGNLVYFYGAVGA